MGRLQGFLRPLAVAAGVAAGAVAILLPAGCGGDENPIEVKVRLPDHEPLEFVARAGNPSPKLTLRRLTVPASDIR